MVRDELLYELVTMKNKRLNIRVSEPYLERLNKLKNHTGVSISEMVRRGLILYLDRNEI
jgi:hypothetical protein